MRAARRIFALAAVLSAFLGTSASAAEPLKLWHSYTKAEREALEQVLEIYRKAHPDVALESSFVPFSALADKLSAAIPRGHGPDLFIFAHDRMGGWAEGGLLEPIELSVDEALLDRHATPCVMALAYKDSLYGLPLAHKALALFLRTDMLGGQPPPESFDALLALAKKHTDKKAGRFGFVYPNADLFFHMPLYFSLGGTLYDPEDPAHPHVTNAGAAASLALARRLFVTEGVLPDDPTPVVESSMFSEGRTPAVISGPWFRGEIDPGVPYTVVPIPAFPGGQPASGFSTCEAVIMSKRSQHKRAAFALMRWLSSDAESARIRMAKGGQTVTLTEAWDKALPAMSASERAIFNAFRTAFERSQPSPSDPSMNAVWTPLNAALYKVIHQGTAPDEALREAQGRIDESLGIARR